MFPAMQVLVLDGGFGTTLEDVFHHNISTPLWSAKPIDDDPELIIDAHLAFLRAGAEIILTATYQCAFSTFERAGYKRDDAVRIMRKSVKLAADARRRFVNEQAGNETWATAKRINIALSLGPFGATLSPAQEFSGFYPPPYGPRAYSEHGPNHNAFPDTKDGWQKEQEAVNALVTFHLERLRVFTEDAEVWDTVDFIAFETVPVEREIKAIRRAIGTLQEEMGKTKPWWVCTVHPGGRFPQERTPGGDRLTVQDVVESALQEQGDAPGNPIPWALGINCTEPKHLGALLEEMTSAVSKIRSENRTTRVPWLVVYPNRGDVYNPTTQTWSSAGPQAEGESWARNLCEVIQPVLQRDIWRGLVVGGCCKTGPEEIAALTKEVRLERLGFDKA